MDNLIRTENFICRRGQKLRKIYKAADKSSKDNLTVIKKNLEEEALRLLSPRFFGASWKKGVPEILAVVLQSLIEGCVVVTFDFNDAFGSVSMARLRESLETSISSKLLKAISTDESSDIYQPVLGNGLPQGLPASPLLFGLYITNELRQISEKFNIYFYLDNGFACFSDRNSANRAIRELPMHLELSGCGMRLSPKPEKKICKIARNRAVPILGVRLRGKELWPGVSGTHFYVTARFLSSQSGLEEMGLHALFPQTVFWVSEAYSSIHGPGAWGEGGACVPGAVSYSVFCTKWQSGVPMSLHVRKGLFEDILGAFTSDAYSWVIRPPIPAQPGH